MNDWLKEAACAEVRDIPFAAWVNEDHPQQDEAKLICQNTCPVATQCLRSAIKDKKSQGVLGGYYFDGGAVLPEDAKLIRLQVKLKVREREADGGEVCDV